MPRNGSGDFSLVTNGWNPAINGTPATAADWMALSGDLASAMTQSVSRDGQTTMTGNLPMGGNKIAGLGAATADGDGLRFEQLFSQGQPQSLASAATTDIGTQRSVFLNITGTTTITNFGSNYNGPRYLIFAAALTLTHSATLALPGAANIVTAAGDSAIVVPIGSPASGWRVVAYQRAAGGSAITGNVNASSLNGGQLAGTRNRLIDGAERVNQSNFGGNWAGVAVGQYGYDIWKKITSTTKGQVIEAGFFKPSTVHTLSGTGVTTAQITSPASGNWTVDVPLAATNVMLEEGAIATPFELIDDSLQLVRVRRYYEVAYAGGVSYGSSGTTVQRVFANWSVLKRATPTVTAVNAGGAATAPLAPRVSLYGALVGFTSTAAGQDAWFRVTADSRL